MECLECGGQLRSPGVDGKDKDGKAVVRWRKCNACNAGFETKETFACLVRQSCAGPLQHIRADLCPICGFKTYIFRTIPTGPGAVVRARVCSNCTTSFNTQEVVTGTTKKYER